MAVAKVEGRSIVHKLTRPFTNTWSFLREVWQELHRVVWPSHEETYTFTVVVLIAVGAVAVWVGSLDWICTQLVALLRLFQ